MKNDLQNPLRLKDLFNLKFVGPGLLICGVLHLNLNICRPAGNNLYISRTGASNSLTGRLCLVITLGSYCTTSNPQPITNLSSKHCTYDCPPSASCSASALAPDPPNQQRLILLAQHLLLLNLGFASEPGR